MRMYCTMLPVQFYKVFPTLFIKGMILGEKFIEHKMRVSSFCITVWNIFNFKKKLARYDQKCKLVFMWSTI